MVYLTTVELKSPCKSTTVEIYMVYLTIIVAVKINNTSTTVEIYMVYLTSGALYQKANLQQ